MTCQCWLRLGTLGKFWWGTPVVRCSFECGCNLQHRRLAKWPAHDVETNRHRRRCLNEPVALLRSYSKTAVRVVAIGATWVFECCWIDAVVTYAVIDHRREACRHGNIRNTCSDAFEESHATPKSTPVEAKLVSTADITLGTEKRPDIGARMFAQSTWCA